MSEGEGEGEGKGEVRMHEDEVEAATKARQKMARAQAALDGRRYGEASALLGEARLHATVAALVKNREAVKGGGEEGG